MSLNNCVQTSCFGADPCSCPQVGLCGPPCPSRCHHKLISRRLVCAHLPTSFNLMLLTPGLWPLLRHWSSSLLAEPLLSLSLYQSSVSTKGVKGRSQPQTGLGQQLSNTSVSGPLYTWPHLNLTTRQRPSLQYHHIGDYVCNIWGGWQYIQYEGDTNIQSIAFKTLKSSGKAWCRSRGIFQRPNFLPSLLIPSRSNRFPILGI